ncbi:hypothetical protein HOY80DRAFT_14060 [Tuber brumale]|nr:hypothetical protein HOY80DRAFT_14060 [Tuber brumale]
MIRATRRSPCSPNQNSPEKVLMLRFKKYYGIRPLGQPFSHCTGENLIYLLYPLLIYHQTCIIYRTFPFFPVRNPTEVGWSFHCQSSKDIGFPPPLPSPSRYLSPRFVRNVAHVGQPEPSLSDSRFLSFIFIFFVSPSHRSPFSCLQLCLYIHTLCPSYAPVTSTKYSTVHELGFQSLMIRTQSWSSDPRNRLGYRIVYH